MSEKYFKALNYSLANEDSSFELGVLPEAVGHVLSIAGSGARVLPLFAKQPAQLSIVDMAPEQLWISELRIEAARVLEHREFLAFFGYPQAGRRRPASPTQRKALLKQLEQQGHLSHDARYFAKSLFESHQWKSPLYVGRWEQTFRRISRITRRVVGSRGLKIFECRTLDEQRAYVESSFPKLRFDLVVRLIGNATTFNRLLYKGHFPRHNLALSSYEHYRRSFNQLFNHSLVRENYFLQLLFLGKLVHAEGNPVECRADVYVQLQQGIRKAKIQYLRGDANALAHEAAAHFGPIDFMSFSDVPSYFTGELESRFMQTLAPALADQAQVVVRNYIHIPENLDLAGFSDEIAQHAALAEAEKLQVYDIHVYRKVVTLGSKAT